MRTVLDTECIDEASLFEGVASGRIAIPANCHHLRLRARGFGAGLRTKVNVNLGVSDACADLAVEQAKVDLAIRHGADAIMDLSVSRVAQAFRREICVASPLPLGTVPVYDAAIRFDKEFSLLTADDLFSVVEEHARDGVDFMTIHAGLTLTALERLRTTPRLTNVVSRGGSLMMEWMIRNERENPFYAEFDRLLTICARHDVTISLGDGLRPGSLMDATDAAQIQELIVLGELTQRAWRAGVQVLIEGPGHIPLHEVASNMQLAKKLCHGAPLYVLGPIVTDVAPGYDHITSAIGGALAAWHGADFLCYVTPAEHLRLPTCDDVVEGIMAARIAAHAGDIAKGLPMAQNWDNTMSDARRQLNWSAMFDLAINPERARSFREQSQANDENSCTMCGTLCAVKRSNEILLPVKGSIPKI